MQRRLAPQRQPVRNPVSNDAKKPASDSTEHLRALLHAQQAAALGSGAAPEGGRKSASAHASHLQHPSGSRGDDALRLRELAFAERPGTSPEPHAPQPDAKAAATSNNPRNRALPWRWVLPLVALGLIPLLHHVLTRERPPTALAQSVQRLADGVIDHTRLHGTLPTALSELEHFPRDAREMSAAALEQLAGNSVEFFYFRSPPAHFTLIGRNTSETWVYEKGTVPALKILQ